MVRSPHARKGVRLGVVRNPILDELGCPQDERSVPDMSEKGTVDGSLEHVERAGMWWAVCRCNA